MYFINTICIFSVEEGHGTVLLQFAVCRYCSTKYHSNAATQAFWNLFLP